MTKQHAKNGANILELELPPQIPAPRELTRPVPVGNVIIGGDYPVSIQTMLTLSPSDVTACVREIEQLRSIGCDLVRIAVTSEQEAKDIKLICEQTPMPVIADIQFDYKLALASIAAGVAKVRLNPGNIGGDDKFVTVIKAAKEAGVALRLGINSGSIDKSITPDPHDIVPALVESAQRSAAICEDNGFTNYIISAKASNTNENISANLALARLLPDVPLHLGLTEAGLAMEGSIRSAYSLGRLLQMGVGNTIRISLTAPVAEEVYAAKTLLQSAGLRQSGFELISCPTCARAGGDVQRLAQQLRAAFNKLDSVNYQGVPAKLSAIPTASKLQDSREQKPMKTTKKRVPASAGMTNHLKRPIRVAVMGCVVNGPGESKESDIGVTFGTKGDFVVFKQGRIVSSKQLKDTDGVVEFVLENLQ